MQANKLRKSYPIIILACLFGLLSSVGCKKEEKIYIPFLNPAGTGTSALPGIPSNPKPADVAQNVPLAFLLDWSDTPNTDTYGLLLMSDDKAPITINNLTESQWFASGLAGNVTYYWKVWAANSTGTMEGPVWSFYTNPNMPYQVNLALPNDGALDIPVTVLLDWNDANKATRYNLYFGAEPDPLLVSIDLSVSQWQASSLDNQTKYYWRVDSTNTYGVTRGPIWSFTTE
ncbi:MAG: hypothetical protein ACYS8W_11385 [Planctomycetota bacterium]|jgi:hypothetical protein